MSLPWGSIIQIALQLLGLGLDRIKANNDMITKFKALVDSAKANGLISVQASDKFQTLHEKLMARMNQPPAP